MTRYIDTFAHNLKQLIQCYIVHHLFVMLHLLAVHSYLY